MAIVLPICIVLYIGCCGIWGKKTIPEKNTDISIFFRDCILLNFMQNLLNIMPKFLFSNDAKQRRYMTHRVRDIFNKVWGHWPVINSLWNSALGIENAYYLLALITALDESCMCDIFDREIVSKHFIQLRIRNKEVLSHQINNGYYVQWG